MEHSSPGSSGDGSCRNRESGKVGEVGRDDCQQAWKSFWTSGTSCGVASLSRVFGVTVVVPVVHGTLESAAWSKDGGSGKATRNGGGLTTSSPELASGIAISCCNHRYPSSLWAVMRIGNATEA